MARKEHWLTTVTCVMCHEIPELPPVYICPLSHSICSSCLPLANHQGCVCKYRNFKQQPRITAEFLHKLRNRPPSPFRLPRRYYLTTARNSNLGSTQAATHEDDSLEKIRKIHRSCIKQEARKSLHSSVSSNLKLSPSKSNSQLEKEFQRNFGWSPDEIHVHYERSIRSTKSPSDSSTSFSKRPVHCPHNPCSKSVAPSSLYHHFIVEHPPKIRKLMERGEPVTVKFRPFSQVESGSTYCEALFQLGETETGASQQTNFWLMSSGSAECEPEKSYIVLWLFTNVTEIRFKCMLELGTAASGMGFGAFCSVNNLQDVQDLEDILVSQNCLLLSFGSVMAMLSAESTVECSITVY